MLRPTPTVAALGQGRIHGFGTYFSRMNWPSWKVAFTAPPRVQVLVAQKMLLQPAIGIVRAVGPIVKAKFRRR